jgi:hypothetical protein
LASAKSVLLRCGRGFVETQFLPGHAREDVAPRPNIMSRTAGTVAVTRPQKDKYVLRSSFDPWGGNGFGDPTPRKLKARSVTIIEAAM